MNNFANLKRPVIVIGFGRSGTTIISDVLFQQGDLAFISNYQVKFPNSPNVNYIRSFFDNALWKLKGQKEQLDKVSFFNKVFFRPSEGYSFWSKLTHENFGRDFLYNKKPIEKLHILHFLNKVVKKQNRMRLGFKLTGPPRLGYLNALFPDAQFIYIKRKPLPNIRSLMNVSFYQGRKHGLWWDGDNVYTEKERSFVRDNKAQPELIAALQYFKINDIFVKEKATLNLEGNILEVNYEDFIRSPEETVKKILTYTHLPWNKNVEAFFNKNNIYNRNKTDKYFFSKQLDNQILEIVSTGI